MRRDLVKVMAIQNQWLLVLEGTKHRFHSSGPKSFTEPCQALGLKPGQWTLIPGTDRGCPAPRGCLTDSARRAYTNQAKAGNGGRGSSDEGILKTAVPEGGLHRWRPRPPHPSGCLRAGTGDPTESPLLGPTGVGREEGRQFPSRKTQVEAAVGNPEDNGQIPDAPGSLPRVSQVALVIKNLPANAGVTGDPGSIPG